MKEIHGERNTSRVNRAYIDDFAAKVKELRSRGVGVVLWWPITIESNLNLNTSLLVQIDSALTQQGIRFDNSPDCFIQPDSMAFDTQYHMSYPAVMDGTRRFIHTYKTLIRKE